MGVTVASAGPFAPRSRTPELHHSIFYKPDALPDALFKVSKHWRQCNVSENDDTINSLTRNFANLLSISKLFYYETQQ